jgi:hypothetical protein
VFHAAWTIWLVVGYPRLTLGEDTLLCALINLAIRAKDVDHFAPSGTENVSTTSRRENRCTFLSIQKL